MMRILVIDVNFDQKNITYRQFYQNFIRILKKLNIKYFTPHKLRHYIASKMHAINIPTKYIQEYGGWANNDVLNKIYTHTIPKQKEIFINKLNNELETMLNDNTLENNINISDPQPMATYGTTGA